MTRPLLLIGNKNYSSWSLRPWLLVKQAGMMELLPGGLMSRDNVDSMTLDNVCGACVQPDVWAPTALEAVAPGYIGRHVPREAYGSFRARAGR